MDSKPATKSICGDESARASQPSDTAPAQRYDLSLVGLMGVIALSGVVLSTFGGLTPIILETSSQARHLIPMAISLGFGIVFATAIILLPVPSLYLTLDDLGLLPAPSGEPEESA